MILLLLLMLSLKHPCFHLQGPPGPPGVIGLLGEIGQKVSNISNAPLDTCGSKCCMLIPRVLVFVRTARKGTENAK